MDLETNTIIKKDKLEAFDVLTKALTISATNINLFIFTILTSLPLFSFLVYYEPFLQKFLLQISEIPSRYEYDDLHNWSSTVIYELSVVSVPTDMSKELVYELPSGLVQIALRYLIPLQLLQLSIILVIVDLASKTLARQEEGEEEEPPLSLKEMVLKPFDVTRVLGTLVTFVYVIIMSTSSLLVLVWLVAVNSVVSMFSDDVLIIVLNRVAVMGLMTMYLGWIAALNMSVVISVLEGRYGTKAIASAICYSFGNEWRGFRLMLVFFAWEVVLRLPCIYFGCKGTRSVGILTQSGLFCLGNVFKWAVFTVYFHDCKNRELQRKLIMKAKKRAVESG